jgi:hypothetical protein
MEIAFIDQISLIINRFLSLKPVKSAVNITMISIVAAFIILWPPIRLFFRNMKQSFFQKIPAEMIANDPYCIIAIFITIVISVIATAIDCWKKWH